MNRRLWVVLLIMASFMPWRVALACAHQAGLVQERCCCLEQRAACPQIKTGVSQCCKTVLAAPSQLADSQADTLPSPDGGKPLAPPPAAIRFTPLPPTSRHDVAWLTPDRGWFAGNETYLGSSRKRVGDFMTASALKPAWLLRFRGFDAARKLGTLWRWPRNASAHGA